MRTAASLFLTALFAGAAAMAQPGAAPSIAQAPEPAAAPRTHSAAELAASHRLAQCLVRDFRPQVVQILELVPGSDPERLRVEALRALARPCAEAAAILLDTQYLEEYEFSATALRGPLAEALYEADFAPAAPGAQAIRRRHIATLPPADSMAEGPRRSPERAAARSFAFCLVANAPDAATGLLALEPGSAAELSSVRGFVVGLEFCLPPADAAEINIATVRGFAAEALYRRSAAAARRQPVDAPTAEQLARRRELSRGAVVIVPTRTERLGSASAEQEPTAQEVVTLTEFARCAARRRVPQAEALLGLDYRQDEYDRVARDLASRSWQCTPDGRLIFSRILFAGGLAEERLSTLLAGAPLAGRIASAPELGTRDRTEAVGHCLLRAQPASVARLLASTPVSAEETALVAELTPQLVDCVPTGQILRVSQSSLRAILAMSAYRLIQSNSAAPRRTGN